jgi:hypothetical protein
MHRLTDKEVSVELSVALSLALLQHGSSLQAKNSVVRTMAHDAILLKLVTAICNDSCCVIRTDLKGSQAPQRAGKFGVDEPWPADPILELVQVEEDQNQLLRFADG